MLGEGYFLRSRRRILNGMQTAGSESVYNKTLAGGADAGVCSSSSNLSGSQLTHTLLQKIDTNSAWENLLEAMESCDKKIIDAWNDELNNLLVFVSPSDVPSSSHD